MDSNHRPHAYQACALTTWAMRPFGGDEEDRTPDPLLAKQVLSQLSYTPAGWSLFTGLFPHFSRSLSESSKLNNDTIFSLADWRCAFLWKAFLLRKEVIQPHLPIRLPCYDFTPVINPTFDSALLAVRLLASGVTDSHGVTGGVYKARERIHRSMLICDY